MVIIDLFLAKITRKEYQVIGVIVSRKGFYCKINDDDNDATNAN